MADKKFIIEVRTKGFAKANRDMGKLDTSSKSYNKTADRMRGTTTGLQGSIGSSRNRILDFCVRRSSENNIGICSIRIKISRCQSQISRFNGWCVRC